MNDTLRTALKKLRLSGLIESLDVRLHEAASHGLNHAEFLELVLQDELVVRSDRLLQRRVKVAGFRDLKTLEDFDWAFNPSIKKKETLAPLLTVYPARALWRPVIVLLRPSFCASRSMSRAMRLWMCSRVRTR